jgi:hypothetical protein
MTKVIFSQLNESPHRTVNYSYYKNEIELNRKNNAFEIHWVHLDRIMVNVIHRLMGICLSELKSPKLLYHT